MMRPLFRACLATKSPASSSRKFMSPEASRDAASSRSSPVTSGNDEKATVIRWPNSAWLVVRSEDGHRIRGAADDNISPVRRNVSPEARAILQIEVRHREVHGQLPRLEIAHRPFDLLDDPHNTI